MSSHLESGTSPCGISRLGRGFPSWILFGKRSKGSAGGGVGSFGGGGGAFALEAPLKAPLGPGFVTGIGVGFSVVPERVMAAKRFGAGSLSLRDTRRFSAIL
jgi:hypothetical protein